MNTGQRIKARRIELGYSAEQVADAIGVSPSTIYRYESNNIANMGIDKLKAVANFLHTDAHVLLGWDITDDDDSDFHSSFYQLVKELSIYDQLSVVLSHDEKINDYSFSDDELREILEFARFKAGVR